MFAPGLSCIRRRPTIFAIEHGVRTRPRESSISAEAAPAADAAAYFVSGWFSDPNHRSSCLTAPRTCGRHGYPAPVAGGGHRTKPKNTLGMRTGTGHTLTLAGLRARTSARVTPYGRPRENAHAGRLRADARFPACARDGRPRRRNFARPKSREKSPRRRAGPWHPRRGPCDARKSTFPGLRRPPKNFRTPFSSAKNRESELEIRGAFRRQTPAPLGRVLLPSSAWLAPKR